MEKGPERMFRPLFRGSVPGMDEPKDDFVPEEAADADIPIDWPGELVEPDENDLAAMADLDAGRYISNEAVMRWLQSIVDGNPIPRPQVGD